MGLCINRSRGILKGRSLGAHENDISVASQTQGFCTSEVDRETGLYSIRIAFDVTSHGK